MTELTYNPDAVRELNEKMGREAPHSQQEWKKAKSNTNALLDKKRGSQSLMSIREELNKK